MSPVTLGSSPLELGGRGRGQHSRGQEAGVREAVRGQLITRLTSGSSGLGNLSLLSNNVLVQRIEILSLQIVQCQRCCDVPGCGITLLYR